MATQVTSLPVNASPIAHNQPPNFYPQTREGQIQKTQIPIPPVPIAPAFQKKTQYHLIIHNLPPNVQDEYIFSELKNHIQIKSFKVPRKQSKENKGYCFLELWNPSDILGQQKKLENIDMLGNKLQVIDYVDQTTLEKIKSEWNFHIDEAPKDLSDEDIRALFSTIGDIISIVLQPSDQHKYGNISFRTEDGATKLRERLRESQDGYIVFEGGRNIKVSEFKQKQERQNTLRLYVNLDSILKNEKEVADLLEAHNNAPSNNSEQTLSNFQQAIKSRLEKKLGDFQEEFSFSEANRLNLTTIDVYLDLGKKSDKLEEKKDKEQHAYAYMQFKKDGQSERERIDLEGRIDMFADFLYRDRTFACLVENAPKKQAEQLLVLKLSDFTDPQLTIEQFKSIVADLSPSLVKDKVPQWKYAIFKQKELSDEHSKLNLYFEPRFKSDLEGLVRKLSEKGDVAKKIKLKKKIKSTQKTIFACFTNSFSVNEISAHGMKLIKDSIESILGKGKEKFFKSQLHIWMNTSLKPNSDKSKETSSNSGVDTGSNASGKLTTLIYLYDRESFNKILKDYKKFFTTLKDFKYNKSLEEQDALLNVNYDKAVLCPYTSLEDIKEYRSKHNKLKSKTDSSRNSSASSERNPINYVHPTLHQAFGIRNISLQQGYQPRIPQYGPPLHHGFHGKGPYNQNFPNQYNNQRGGGHNPNHHYQKNQNPNQPPSHNPTPSVPGIPSQIIQYNSIQNIEDDIDAFRKLPEQDQRNFLGKLVHEQVTANITDDSQKVHIPRITGMLIDLSVFEIDDIIELIQNPEDITQRINEALQLIQSETNLN